MGNRNDPKTDAELARLGREQSALIKDLLGPDAGPNDEWTAAMRRRQYGNLPPEKIDRLQSVLSDYGELRSSIFSEARGMILKEDEEKIALLEKEQRADIEKLFTPSELEEYDLRNSPLSNRLRMELSAFNPSEEEFKTLYRLYREAGNNPNGTLTEATSSQPGAAVRIGRVPQSQELLNAVVQALGPERAAEYQQARDPAYQQASRLLERLNLPAALAADVVSTQQDLQSRVNEVQRDRTLSADDRTAKLTALAAEADSRFTATLGARGYEVYKRYGGNWVTRIVPTSNQARPPG
jgi:hypothetical protein